MRVLLVAATTGYQTRAFSSAAQSLGIDLVLATDRCHVIDDPWGDNAIAVRFEDPDVEAIKARGPFDGVIAVGDKPSYVASLMDLNFHPPAAVQAAKDKFLARQKFRKAGLLTPNYKLVTEPESVRYPCVLKPLRLSASRGVIRANNDQEFVAAFDRIKKIAAEPAVLVEDFIPGHEYALEGIVTDGRLQVLALFDKPDPLDGPFFEETIYVTIPVIPAIEETTQKAVTALGLRNGPIHAEMRVNEKGVWMLEVAARPIGGLCSRVLRFTWETAPDSRGSQHDLATSSIQSSLEYLILRHAIGENISAAKLEPNAHAVMMIPIPRAGIYQGVTGLDPQADIVITAKEGQEMIPLPEGASYLGFIFAHRDTPEEAVRALRDAHSKLHFDFAQTLPVVK